MNMEISNITFQVLTLSTFVSNECLELVIFTIIFLVTRSTIHSYCTARVLYEK